MHAGPIAHAVALLTELPRFTPAQWQRLFWDAGLKKATVHLYMRDPEEARGAPWTMVVETPRGLVELEAFASPLSAEALQSLSGRESLLRVARSHAARVEVSAVEARCPPEYAHEAVARAAAAVLRTTWALAWLQPGSGILLPAPSCAAQVRERPEGEFPVELYATVRATHRVPTVIVDTVGLAHAGLSDLEIEVDAEDAVEAQAFLAELVRALLARRQRLEEGASLPGPLGLAWKPSARRATVAPQREVLRFGLAG